MSELSLIKRRANAAQRAERAPRAARRGVALRRRRAPIPTLGTAAPRRLPGPPCRRLRAHERAPVCSAARSGSRRARFGPARGAAAARAGTAHAARSRLGFPGFGTRCAGSGVHPVCCGRPQSAPPESMMPGPPDAPRVSLMDGRFYADDPHQQLPLDARARASLLGRAAVRSGDHAARRPAWRARRTPRPSATASACGPTRRPSRR